MGLLYKMLHSSKLPMHRSLIIDRVFPIDPLSLSAHKEASIFPGILGEFYLARCAQSREDRLVSSNRDFTSTLYSGMRASCATSANLSRPLPHYLVHAPRIDATTKKTPSIQRIYRDYSTTTTTTTTTSLHTSAKLVLARVCFPSIPILDYSPRPMHKRASVCIWHRARVSSVSSFENVARGEIFAGTRLHRGFIRYPRLTDSRRGILHA